MTRACWWLVDVVSRTLEPDERDAVRGDLAESDESGGRALLDVIGLVARRQAALWRSWPPWLILMGLVVPLGVLLSLGSRSMANGTAIPIWMYLNNWTTAYLDSPGSRLNLFGAAVGVFKVYLILACWSWASGFVLGSLSRRSIPAITVLFWVAVLLPAFCAAPGFADHRGSNAAVFSLTFYNVIFPLIVQAGLVMIPSTWGMRHGGGLDGFPWALRALLLAGAIVSVAALVIMNVGWVLCSIGRFEACMEWAVQVGHARVTGRSPIVPIPTLALALAGPLGYTVAAVVRRRLRGKIAAA